MGVNTKAQAGQGQIELFEITSNYSGETVDIREGVTSLYLFESIFDSTVRACVTYLDTGYGEGLALSEDKFNNSAGEKTELIVRDGDKRKLKFVGNFELRTSNNARESMTSEDTTMTSITTWFYSKESLMNHVMSSRVTKKYERKISDNVYAILKEDCLKTPKPVFVDPSKNDFNFLGGNEKPFHKVTWLCKRTVPQGVGGNGITSGYFFYEVADGAGTPGGYYFKSVDKLLGQSPIRRFILTNTNDVPVGYDAKIISQFERTSIDAEKHIISGSLMKRDLETFDPFTNKYVKDDFSYKDQNLKTNNAATSFWKVASDINFQDSITRNSQAMLDTGTLPTGRSWKEQKKESKQINFQPTEIIRQSENRYNQLGSVNIEIVIAMDLGIHVGDIVFIDIPEISSKKSKKPSKNKGGNYLVVDISHKLGQEGCWTSLHLLRDTINSKN